MANARTGLKWLRWLGLALLIGVILLQMFLQYQPGAESLVAMIERGFLFLALGAVSVGVLGLILHFLGSLRRPAEDADWGEPLLCLRHSRIASVLTVVVLLLFGAMISFALGMWSLPGDAFAFEQEPIPLEGKAIIGFFTVVWVFLVVAITTRAVRNPPWFVLTAKGFVYQPGDVSAGLIRWQDVADIKEDEVITNGGNGRGGPVASKTLVVVLRNGERYVTRYNPVLSAVVRLGTGVLRAQTGGRGDIYIDPADFGPRYDEIKTMMRELAGLDVR